MKVLMVCLGNICRSPLAHGLLEQKVKDLGLGWTVDSAGTGGWHVGNPPDGRSIAVAKVHGLDISGQTCRKFRSIDFDEYDLIYAMDASNYQDICKQSTDKADHAKVHMILNEVNPGRNGQVPDPYWDDNGFEQVYQMLDEATDKIIEKYKQ